MPQSPKRRRSSLHQTLVLDGRVLRGVQQWTSFPPEQTGAAWGGLVEFGDGSCLTFTARNRTRRGTGLATRDSFTGVQVLGRKGR